jgi:heme-degrading monooxygenase HmoA
MNHSDRSMEADTEADRPRDFPFVAFSEIRVPAAGAAALAEAFADRLREVEGWPGFGHLEVWRDARDQTRFVMVSWWNSQDRFVAYMRSASHRRSHDRIQGGPDRPRAAAFTRFQVVAR